MPLKLVVFDLDDTVWYPEMYMLYGPPFRIDKDGTVRDSSGTEIYLIKGARKVLEELRSTYPDIKIGFASRTNYPEWANKCLKLFKIHDKTLDQMADYKEIYPGDKKSHFRSFKKDSGIEFEDMAFFDNENRNCVSVRTLGVKCYYTPQGMTCNDWKKCKAEFNL